MSVIKYKLEWLNLLCIIFFLNVNLITAKGVQYVTYNSVVKLLNDQFNVRLHSHDIKYGTGSGQQSVTAIEIKEDGNSYWFIKGETGKPIARGKPIKCGDSIRLEHSATKKNLHSHHVSSPLSGKQEVSAYGSNGHGDTGDHWMVLCEDDYWEKENTVNLKHVDTGAFLGVSGRTYGQPISGQAEVVGEYAMGDSTLWKVMEGVFLHPLDKSAHQEYHHTEL